MLVQRMATLFLQNPQKNSPPIALNNIGSMMSDDATYEFKFTSEPNFDTIFEWDSTLVDGLNILCLKHDFSFFSFMDMNENSAHNQIPNAIKFSSYVYKDGLSIAQYMLNDNGQLVTNASFSCPDLEGGTDKGIIMIPYGYYSGFVESAALVFKDWDRTVLESNNMDMVIHMNYCIGTVERGGDLTRYTFAYGTTIKYEEENVNVDRRILSIIFNLIMKKYTLFAIQGDTHDEYQLSLDFLDIGNKLIPYLRIEGFQYSDIEFNSSLRLVI